MAERVVLVVDDEEPQRKVLAGFLRKRGVKVETAAGADEAVTLAGAKTLDLVLTDLRMPGRDGVALLDALGGMNPELPVIVGVSGGPDSLCLMDVLRKARYRIIVVHFNHKLRPDSDTDANIVEQTAARLNLASVIQSGDVQTVSLS